MKNKTMKLSSLTHLAFETNAVLDACPDFDLPLAEVHAAARQGVLIQHLAKRFGDKADLSMLLTNPDELHAVDFALCDAVSSLEGCGHRKIGVTNNGLCLVLAIILEVIQQEFSSLPLVEAGSRSSVWV